MIPTEDMRIYAPDVMQFEKESRQILRRYKTFIEFICVKQQTEDEIIAKDKQGNTRPFNPQYVFTKREFQTLYPRISNVLFPARRKKGRKSPVIYRQCSIMMPSVQQKQVLTTSYISYLLKTKFRFNKGDIKILNSVFTNTMVNHQTILNTITQIYEKGCKANTLQERNKYIKQSILQLQEVS